MTKGSHARVIVRAPDIRQLLAFLGSRRLDLGGRPHLSPAKKEEATPPVWQAEFYLPLVEAETLKAEGCTFVVDATFFERLQAARKREVERSQTGDHADVFKRGRPRKPDPDPSGGAPR